MPRDPITPQVRYDKPHQTRGCNDPTTCDLDLSEAEEEFNQALQLYREVWRRPYPTGHEVLEVLVVCLGYRKDGPPLAREALRERIRGLPRLATHRATAPSAVPLPAPADLATSVPRVEVPESRRADEEYRARQRETRKGRKRSRQEVPERPKPARSPAPCRRCPKPHYSRGLCLAHYQQARRQILAGKTTWEAVAAGA